MSQWESILKIDYKPVFYPASSVLKVLPPGFDGRKIAIEVINAALHYAPVMGNIRMDYAGPLYHRLLDTAPNDGSFYTTTPAAIILARLAIPADWTNWEVVDVDDLRLIDPACGTGTLLMAALQTIKERIIATRGDDLTSDDLVALHRYLVEKVIHGIDINRHAVHLAACMLTFAAPDADYRRMNLDRYPHGPYKEYVQAGSLDLLAIQDSGKLAYHDDLNREYEELESEDATKEASVLKNMESSFDLVIMNPPYTRDSLRNHQHDTKIQKMIDNREKEIKDSVSRYDKQAGDAINLKTVQTFFFPIADRLLKKNKRTLATVLPFATSTGAAALEQRKFLSKRFHVETVITSHDPDRINFSGNTAIYESLVVAREITDKTAPTKFISLHHNPRNNLEALAMVDCIEKDDLQDWGSSVLWPREKMLEGNWMPSVFYDTRLVRMSLEILASKSLDPIGEMADLEPDGRIFRGKSRFKRTSRNSGMTALWYHTAQERETITVKPDSWIQLKTGPAKNSEEKDFVDKLWRKRSQLLLANRFRMNTVHVIASWATVASLGNAWIPVTPDNPSQEVLKAWCMWANSTPNFLIMLSIRQKSLDYASFSLAGLRMLPFPNPNKTNISPLVEIFDKCSKEKLKPFHLLHEDSVRSKIDEAAAEVSGINLERIAETRKLISMEPTIMPASSYTASLSNLAIG